MVRERSGNRVNKVFLSASWNIFTLLLFGWVLVEFFNFQMQFADIMKNPEPPWEITMNFFPILLFFVICTPIYIYLFVKAKKKYKSMWKALMLPAGFEESDEREQMITAKACRSSYIMMWFITPVAAALLLLYPMVQDAMPYYPIIVILIIPVAQVISYFYTFHKYL